MTWNVKNKLEAHLVLIFAAKAAAAKPLYKKEHLSGDGVQQELLFND
ncbi:hypothetical protein [Sodalis sp. RH16]